ncbi:MAG: hypothetical protein GXY83_12110 [Rhodopirellula sp.]|nr:hypothetical protein [Rhodopirellula sp.]
MPGRRGILLDNRRDAGLCACGVSPCYNRRPQIEHSFDVRQSLEAAGWIYTHVILPEGDDSPLASRTKAALAGGPDVARAIVDLESHGAVTAGQKLFDRKLKLDLKLAEAVELPLATNREKMFFIKLNMDLMAREQRLELHYCL